MTDLEKIREWLKTYPNFSILDQFQIDYTDQIPNNGGIFPSGLIESNRKTDILGNVTVQNQLNFGLYYVFPKAPADDVGAAINAEWVADFQSWVQEQSATGKAPTFGTNPRTEQIKAQNGMLYAADGDGTAMYMVQLSVSYTKTFKKGGILNA